MGRRKSHRGTPRAGCEVQRVSLSLQVRKPSDWSEPGWEETDGGQGHGGDATKGVVNEAPSDFGSDRAVLSGLGCFHMT